MCDWGQWVAHIEAEFRDTHHQFRNQTKLLDLWQKTSVQKYNEEFRTLMMEVCHVMSSQDLLVVYVRGLKPAV